MGRRWRPSAISASSMRTSSQDSSRASAASASETRARTSSDFTDRDGRLHRLGDLLIGQGVHLAQDERCLLSLGQVVDVADQQPELLALVHLVGGGGAVLGEVVVHRVHADRLGSAQMVQAPVAGDPVQPRTDVDRPVVGEDRVERGGHHLLEDVLGILARARADDGRTPATATRSARPEPRTRSRSPCAAGRSISRRTGAGAAANARAARPHPSISALRLPSELGRVTPLYGRQTR